MRAKRVRRAAAVLAAGTVLALVGLAPVPLGGVAAADTVIVVDTTKEGVDPSDGFCSLVEAMYAAEHDDNTAVWFSPPDAVVETDCAAGSGADTIVLPAGAVITMTRPVDDLRNPTGPTATPIVRTPIVIEGNGARIERSGTIPFRAFAVESPGDLTLRNVHVKGFFAKGGNGGIGGGGGLGAGGAVYLKSGRLLVESSTFEGNRAEGGNGGSGSHIGGGGGGGGLGGSGGHGIGIVQSAFTSGGGGGGGARGDGGTADACPGGFGQCGSSEHGGGGGGTVTDGVGDHEPHVFPHPGGLACGGDGGEYGGDGADGCDGGGGGGGGEPNPDPFFDDGGAAGNGGYGGGGGGGGYQNGFNAGFSTSSGGQGGFGGGGGAGGTQAGGGFGGFGAGGGGGSWSEHGGAGGTFGGHGGHDADEASPSLTGAGGGGAGLGGAIFSDLGTVTVRNSTFTANSASHGFAGIGQVGATNGADAGGAIFMVDGTLNVSGSTVAGNESTGAAAGIAIYGGSRPLGFRTLNITNTIVAMNIPTTDECSLYGNAASSGAGNLYTDNAGCAGWAVAGDPMLAPLAIEAPGVTPTMAIDASSLAFDAGDDATCEQFDQRGVSRPRSLHCDIGAYEYIKPSADLAAGTTPVDPVVAGEDLRYLVDVHNNGPTAAENVTVTDTLPAGTTYVSITGSGGFTCTGTGPVTCTNPLMSEGATALLTLTVHLAPNLADGSAITNRVAVSSSKTPDPVPANNTAAVSTTVATRADVSVTKSGSSTPTAGTAVTYSITVDNRGPSVARNVALTETVPAGTRFTSLTAPLGWSCSPPLAGAAGPTSFGCSTVTMPPGTSATFGLTVDLAASVANGSQLCNTPTVSSSTTDPVAGNNASETCGTVRALADLRVSQSATTTGKPGKGTAAFTVTVTNLGPSDSQGVALAATSSLFNRPPPSTSATAGGACTVAGSTVNCSWPSLAVGSSAQVTISVPWRSSVGSVCISDSVTAGTPDPNASNNQGSDCVSKR